MRIAITYKFLWYILLKENNKHLSPTNAAGKRCFKSYSSPTNAVGKEYAQIYNMIVIIIVYVFYFVKLKEVERCPMLFTLMNQIN